MIYQFALVKRIGEVGVIDSMVSTEGYAEVIESSLSEEMLAFPLWGSGDVGLDCYYDFKDNKFKKQDKFKLSITLAETGDGKKTLFIKNIPTGSFVAVAKDQYEKKELEDPLGYEGQLVNDGEITIYFKSGGKYSVFVSRPGYLKWSKEVGVDE